MENKGHIALHRQILDSKVWTENPSKVKVFLYILLKANHKDVERNGMIYKRGEHITSLEIMAKEMGMTRPTVTECLKWLHKNGYLEVEIIRYLGTKLRVVNYDTYQFSC